MLRRSQSLARIHRRRKMRYVERVVRIFKSHAEADAADREFYRSLTPQQRVDMLLELIEMYREETGESAERLERVCRITQFERR